MKRVATLRLGATGILCGALALSVAGTAAAQEAVRIGTSSVGSTFYTIAIGASEVITKHAGINATAEPVGGSSANVRGLAAQKIEFALANSFAAFSGYRGTFNFEKSGPAPVRLVMQAHASSRWIWKRKGAGIEQMADFNGRTVVAKRRALPEIELVMDAFIKANGLDADSMHLVATTNTPQTVKAMRAGSVDAVVVPFSRGSAAVQKPLMDDVYDFVYVSEEKIDEMLGYLPPMMWRDVHPKGTYPGQERDLNLISMNTYFLTRPGVSEETVYQVTKALLENNEEFQSYHKLARHWTAENSLKNVALPFHPGAIRYYKEKGLWTPELEATQQELLK